MKYRCTYEPCRPGAIEAALWLDGEKVSRLSLHPLKVRIGASEVLMGGIGGVSTPPQHRKKGYCAIVMSDCNRWMRDQGYDISLLFGIPDFYYRWGFITSLARPRVVVPTRYAEEVKKTSRPRELTDKNIAEAIRIYNRDNTLRTLTVVRRKSTWRPRRRGVRWGQIPTTFGYYVKGKMVAVASWSLEADSVECCELSTIGPSALGGVLRHAAKFAIERRVEKITFHVPVDHPMADFCREQGGEVIQNVPHVSGGMGRIMNQTPMFEKIAPELNRRLSESALSKWSGSIDMATDLDTTRLNVKRGQVAVGKPSGRANVKLECPQQRLTQLVLGFQPIRFLTADTKAKLTGDRDGIIDRLFPKGEPHVWVPDYF